MMSDNANAPLPTPSPSPTPARRRPSPWLFIAVAALLLAGWQWFETRQRLSEAEAANQEVRGALKQVLAQVETLQGKLGATESKLAEVEQQNTAAQTLYQDLAHGREAATLLEIEQAITLAGQQLQLAGNVQAAVLALQTADAHLARLDRPQFLPLRKAVGRDLAKLSALPVVDLAGLSLRLEQGIAGIDQLPLAAYGRPAVMAEKAETAPTRSGWQNAADEFWQEIKGLIRIQRFDRDETVLLAPGQEFFLRENLKLRLLSARLALLARDPGTFRNELKVAQGWLARHFDGDNKAVQAKQAVLRQLASTDIAIELPTLNDSQTALRNLGNGKEKR